MQTISKKTSDPKNRKEKKEELKKSQEEKLKKNVYPLSTPRAYAPKTNNASDIYGQNKNAKAPKKVPGVSSTSYASPMKGLLRSSASSISQLSSSSRATLKLEGSARSNTKSKDFTTKTETRKKELLNETPRKKELFTNVTVNSPVAKRKLDLNSERVLREIKRVSKSKEIGSGEPRSEVKGVVSKRTKDFSKEVGSQKPKETGERHRTKTRTLEESEVKVLTSDNDNNVQMQNLSKKLAAKPKAFFIDLDEEKPISLPEKGMSDDDVSYEDDFESYESDFESYHSEVTGSEASENKVSENEASENEASRSEASKYGDSERNNAFESSLKEKDEERMLDSGNFDLRDRSGRVKQPMDFILEDAEKCHLKDKSETEDAKKTSLDEGFQDMNVPIKIEILSRPIFIDLAKSKQNKLRRKVSERLKQRAKDLLSMITLHEMPYSLYEMQPISYDLYMTTFGRSNYTQSGVQTFEDGITEEIQTDEIASCQKWTQYPIEFSKNDIFESKDALARKYSKQPEDYLTKFTFLVKENVDHNDNNQIKMDSNYKENPLRIYFEQKDGAGGDEMLPYETYKSKLKSNDYNAKRLGKFLKKFEGKVSHILSKNTGQVITGVEKSGKLPFSKGHVTISPKLIQQKYSFLHTSKITKAIFSDTKSNLILTVHRKAKGIDAKKNLVCLWDLSVATEPMKVLLAIDDIAIGRFRGNTDGIFVAALDDGSIHLWDLSEEPSWHDSDASEEKSTDLVGVDDEQMTTIEQDREWNLRNRNVGLLQPPIPFALQSCAFTSSASNITSMDTADCIVGLEVISGQIVSLQRIGILTIWSIKHDKRTNKDIGKAFCSKMSLDRHQTINISEHIDTIKENISFNLNSAKRRLSQRKQEKAVTKEIPRPKSSISLEFDSVRPYSAASLRKKVLPAEINVPKSWENGVVCNDLKIVELDNVYSFLIAKNCGEVLCCKRCLGVVRIERFSVANDTSSITSLDVSAEGIPYFLAASDSGTVSLCSLLENRALLTLDCRNVSPYDVDKCNSDQKGRFVSSVPRSTVTSDESLRTLAVKSVFWSRVNHCCIFVLVRDESLLMFDLTRSDINALLAGGKTAAQLAHTQHAMALVTSDGDVEVHKLTYGQTDKDSLHLFNKYVALL